MVQRWHPPVDMKDIAQTYTQNTKSFSFVFPTLYFHINHNDPLSYPTSPTTSNLNPEESNLINGTLTDYDDGSGHHAEGIIIAHTMALHLNLLWDDECKRGRELNILTTFGWKLIDAHLQQALGHLGKKNLLVVGGEWASARPHYDDEWGPQVNESDIVHLSIPLCHSESLCSDGYETFSLITRKCIYVAVKQKDTLIWVETLLLTWGIPFTSTWYIMYTDDLDTLQTCK